jgi:hypothetical protein
MNDIAECNCSARIANGQSDDGDIAVGGCTNGGLRQLPVGVIELRLKLRDRRVDTADLGIEREFGALLRSLRGAKLRRHRLVLDLLVLRLELRVGFISRERLDVGKTFSVVGDLRGQPADIRRCLFVIRFQDLDLLLRRGERGLQLRHVVLKRRRVDLKQHVVGLHRHVRLDRDRDNLSRHIRRHFHHAAGHRHAPRRREIVKKREKCRKDKPAY